tara:strand:- start:1350 stop:1697 length:348 start_codon:yes stop_codon:yes gene_type:complete
MSDRRIDVSWKCEREGSGSSGIPLKHSGLSELQLMELITHLRMTLEGATYVDGCMDEKRVPYWKLERINWEHDKTDKAWDVLMKFHEKELEWEAIDDGHIDCDVEAGTVGVEGEE